MEPVPVPHRPSSYHPFVTCQGALSGGTRVTNNARNRCGIRRVLVLTALIVSITVSLHFLQRRDVEAKR